MIDATPSAAAVKRQLDRLLESRSFRKADKAAALLDFIVEETLKGKPHSEYDIGVRLFCKPKDWSPKEDSEVRTNISRLAERLDGYYDEDGANDLVVIGIVNREAVCRYNHLSPFMPSPPEALKLDFVGELENFFAEPATGEVLCVVTGESADWHHLDGDACNNALGNLIPLSPRLSFHIRSLARGALRTNLPELQPVYLAELARAHFAQWRMASAYACAHLAFYMGEPPFGNETPDLRLQHLSDALSHIRHRFNESIVANLIRHSLLPLVVRLGSLDPRTLFHLTLQLSGILDEGAHFVTAARALSLAERVADRFPSLVFQEGALNRFSLLRRRAQLLMERAPADKHFDYLAKQAEEETLHNPNLPLTLQIIVTHRWFRQATPDASRKTYESLMPLVARLNDVVFSTSDLTKPPQVDSANLAALLISSAVAASHVHPGGWEESAREMLAKAKRICRETGYALPGEFWQKLSDRTLKENPFALAVSLLPHSCVMPRLRESARMDIETVLSCLEKVLIIEKAEPALIWRSPWSSPRPNPKQHSLPGHKSR